MFLQAIRLSPLHEAHGGGAFLSRDAIFPLAEQVGLRYNGRMQAPLRIGTRGSELALRQVQLFVDALHEQVPGLATEVVVIQTAGDRRTDLPLCCVNRATGTADKGVFIATIEEALARGEIDCAVHSCKDMPGALDERMALAAVLPREDRGEALIIKPGARMEAPTIGTASVRRAELVKAYWGGRARTVSIRGNVQTRLRKLLQQEELDALLLARAGLNRLGYAGRQELEFEGSRLCIADLGSDVFMPALCQGAIVVEVRRADSATYELVRRVNHAPSELTIRAERAFLAALGADCSVPVAGYASANGRGLMLRVIYVTADGTPVRLTLKGDVDHPEELGREAAAQLAEWR